MDFGDGNSSPCHDESRQKKTKTAEVMGPALKLLAFTDFLRISGGKKTVSPISGTT